MIWKFVLRIFEDGLVLNWNYWSVKWVAVPYQNIWYISIAMKHWIELHNGMSILCQIPVILFCFSIMAPLKWDCKLLTPCSELLDLIVNCSSNRPVTALFTTYVHLELNLVSHQIKLCFRLYFNFHKFPHLASISSSKNQRNYLIVTKIKIILPQRYESDTIRKHPSHLFYITSFDIFFQKYVLVKPENLSN